MPRVGWGDAVLCVLLPAVSYVCRCLNLSEDRDRDVELSGMAKLWVYCRSSLSLFSLGTQGRSGVGSVRLCIACDDM
jgi:hypothetical protein